MKSLKKIFVVCLTIISVWIPFNLLLINPWFGPILINRKYWPKLQKLRKILTNHISYFQIGADGRRSQIFLALSTAAEFRDHLSTFSDYYASLGPPNPENVPEDGKLKSEMMIKDNRRYYLDLKENSRGRFLRVSIFILIPKSDNNFVPCIV